MEKEEKEIKNKKKNDLPELEDDSEFEDGLSTAAAYCPYLRAQSFFKRFFPKNEALEYLENYKFENSKYPSLPFMQGGKGKCPFFRSTSPFFSDPKIKSKIKCPYSSSTLDDEEKGFPFVEIKKEKTSETKKSKKKIKIKKYMMMKKITIQVMKSLKVDAPLWGNIGGIP